MTRPRIARFAMLTAAALAARPAWADLPVTGVPVPELSEFDDAMQQFMEQNGITAGVLAVSRNGCIIYQRGFGWSFYSSPLQPLPEIAPMRLASVEKPLTAAAVRTLAAAGVINLNDNVFDLDPVNGGILSIAPWQGLGDSRLAGITVMDLLNHLGGWDRGAALHPWSGAPGFDPMLNSAGIRDAMGLSDPPSREQIASFMLSQPLQFDPGGPICDSNGNGICQPDPPPPPDCSNTVQDNYSNFGFMLLGLIVEQAGGMSHQQYLRQNIVTPDMWVPGTELFRGRTHRVDQNPREPLYSSSGTCEDVYPPNNAVACPYGGFDLEAMVGHGNLVAGAVPLIRFLDRYYVIGCGIIGAPLAGLNQTLAHAGRLTGTSTIAMQRDDGINIVVLFNKREPADAPHYANDMASQIDAQVSWRILLDLPWPTFCVDGFWVDFNQAESGTGGYNDPFASLSTALAQTGAGTKLRFKPGTSGWTGVVNQKMRMDAPFGLARIGAP